LKLRRIAYVELDSGSLTAILDDGGGDLFGETELAVGQDHRRALLCKHAGESRTYARSAAGDERNLVGHDSSSTHPDVPQRMRTLPEAGASATQKTPDRSRCRAFFA
jgi:hypothetical protein